MINKQTVTNVVYDQKDKLGANTFLRRFGSWNKALLKQGILFRILRDVPELRMGYEYVYYNTKAHSPLYWSPDNLRIN